MSAKYPKTASIVQPRASVRENAGKAARPNASGADIQARIRERAYQLFERRGRANGFDRQDWIQAEIQIRKELGS